MSARYPYRVKMINGKKHKYYYWRFKDIDGKTRELSATSEKALENRIKAKQMELLHGVEIPDISFADYLKSWLSDVHCNGKKPSTQSRYWSLFHNHIETQKIGAFRLKNMTLRSVQNFYNDYMKIVNSANTIKNIHKLLSPCMRYAYANGEILKDFSSLLTIPSDPPEIIQARIARNSVKPLTVSEQLNFVKFIQGHELEALLRTAIDGGYRQGELFALTWKDIDFDRQRIIINKNWSYAKNELTGKYEGHTVATKNFQTRKNKMPSALSAILLQHKYLQRERLAANKVVQTENTLVFCTPLGTHLDKNNVTKQLKQIYEAIGINQPGKGHLENKCFHDLRHTYATRQFEMGIEVLTVSRLLGHRNINTTLSTYIHVLDDLRDATADATDDFYAKHTNKELRNAWEVRGNLLEIKK